MCQGIFHKIRPSSCLPFLSSCTTPDPAPLPHVRDEKGTSLCGFFPGVSLQGASPLFTTSPTLLATYMETELCRSNKNHNRVISFEGHLFIFPMFFASSRRCVPPSSLPFFSVAVKREQQGRGNAQVSRASSSSHGHPTAAKSVGEELPSA